jgi:hypothetical protein
MIDDAIAGNPELTADRAGYGPWLFAVCLMKASGGIGVVMGCGSAAHKEEAKAHVTELLRVMTEHLRARFDREKALEAEYAPRSK